MLLHSIRHKDGRDFFDVGGTISKKWGAERVARVLDALGVRRLWIVAEGDEKPTPFVSTQAMHLLLDALPLSCSKLVPLPDHSAKMFNIDDIGNTMVMVRACLSPDHDRPIKRAEGSFPQSWTVRDVIVAFAAEGQLPTQLLGAYSEPSVLIISAATGRTLNLSMQLTEVGACDWLLVSTEEHTICVLRGFPWNYRLADVLKFIWDNGVAPTDVRHVWLEARRGDDHSFNGFVGVALRRGFSVASCAALLHMKWAGSRYVEVLSSRHSKCRSCGPLTQRTTPVWWHTVDTTSLRRSAAEHHSEDDDAALSAYSDYTRSRRTTTTNTPSSMSPCSCCGYQHPPSYCFCASSSNAVALWPVLFCFPCVYSATECHVSHESEKSQLKEQV